MPTCTLKDAPDSSWHNAINPKVERNTWWVIYLTLIMMVAEIGAGMVFGSMALLADGWQIFRMGLARPGYRRRWSRRDPEVVLWIAARHRQHPA